MTNGRHQIVYSVALQDLGGCCENCNAIVRPDPSGSSVFLVVPSKDTADQGLRNFTHEAA